MIEQETPTEVPEPTQETATLSLSILGGQQVSDGDVVRLKVLSVDSESGTFDVAYAHPAKKGAINSMAAAFDAEQTMPETEM